MRLLHVKTLSVFLVLFCLPYVAVSASLLGPIGLAISDWYCHFSSHSFSGEEGEEATIIVTKELEDSAISGGFIVINFQAFSLNRFFHKKELTLKKTFKLRKSNRLYAFLRGKPGGALHIEITQISGNHHPIATFIAEPKFILKGEASTLSWKTENADSIQIQPEIGVVAANGSMEVSPLQSTVYTLTATGKEGEVSRQVEIEVRHPLPKIRISAEPETVLPGESAILAWSTQNAASCSLDNGIGKVPTSGNMTVFPLTDTAYTMTAVGPGGSSKAQTTIYVRFKKIPTINKSEADYKTPENTLAASSSALLAEDLEWYYTSLSQDALIYEKQLFGVAGIDPSANFNLVDESHDEYILLEVPYKNGVLVIIEEHYNDTDGTIYTSAAGMVQEDGLWKITYAYGEDEEVEAHDSFRFTNCIAGYEFHVDSFEDSCLHDNDLTLIDNTTIFLANRHDKDLTAAHFNGLDSALGGLLNDLPEDKISIGGWIKAQQVDQEMTVVEIGSGPENGITIMLDKGPGIIYRVHLGNTVVERHVASGFDFRDEAWHHLYLTYDGSHLRFYIDGELKDTVASSGAINADTNLNLGQSGGTQGNPSQFFNGMLDDFQIHNIALSQEQVLEKFTK